LHVYGKLPARRDFFRLASTCDVGLCLIPTDSGDVNRRFAFGASNKCFDYLACGLAVVVPNQDEWTSQVVAPGYGIACETYQTETLRSMLKELRSKPAELRRMGELGRQRILNDWNYETQFEPVRLLLDRLSSN
ncbi:MAG: glycosyltransferase family protein, partial [Pirellulales bacterium]